MSAVVGLEVIPLGALGAEVKGVVSYHGILTTQLPAPAGSIKAEVVAYCGGKDPFAPLETALEETGSWYRAQESGTDMRTFTLDQITRLTAA